MDSETNGVNEVLNMLTYLSVRLSTYLPVSLLQISIYPILLYGLLYVYKYAGRKWSVVSCKSIVM